MEILIDFSRVKDLHRPIEFTFDVRMTVYSFYGIRGLVVNDTTVWLSCLTHGCSPSDRCCYFVV